MAGSYTPVGDVGVKMHNVTTSIVSPMQPEQTGDIIATRCHAIYKKRCAQLALNLLALEGGRPYIDSRLSRFPSEDDADWSGDKDRKANGRKDRATLTNYVARITSKTGQYVFASPIQREGADQSFIDDTTKTQISMDEFMATVLDLVLLHKWCWVSVDMPKKEGPRSVAEKERLGIRPYWQLWTALDVVDWAFDDDTGTLTRVICEYEEYVNDDLMTPAKMVKYREVYRVGSWGKYELRKKENSTDVQAILIESEVIDEVPFILCGNISGKPHWMDDLELMQRAQMDLASCLQEALTKSAYGQPVLPESMMQEQDTETGSQTHKQRKGYVRRRVGLRYPIIERPDESGISRYITPDLTAIAEVRTEIKERKAEMYEMVGMAMSVPESRQVASAESKQWDHLDPETVLREKATMLEDCERRGVELSKRLDPTFKEYRPIYGKKFDISDFAGDLAALVNVTNGIALPPLASAEIQRKTMQLVDRRFPIDPEKLEAIMEEIDTEGAMDIPDVPFVNPRQPGQAQTA